MKRWIFIPTGGIALIWLLSIPPQAFLLPDFWILRRELILLTGVLAYVLMAWTMVLSTRLPWIEQKIGGLDRVFAVHKWTGITAAVFTFIHWMMEIVPKKLAGSGWIASPVRGPRPVAADGDWFPLLKDAAVLIGEWMAYALLALVLIALVRRIPYHWFRRLHKLFPAIFLLISFHTLILMPATLWLTAGGVVTAVALLAGCCAALLSLSGRIGRERTTTGTVTDVIRQPNGFLEVCCALDGGLSGYRPGHFAFARFSGSLDPHPFSIISFDEASRHIRFLIKPLGDDTRRLATSLRPGDSVRVEGPYGAFDFSSQTTTQIWIGGGVGIAPFLSQMEHLIQKRRHKKDGDTPHIRLIYCARANDTMIPTLTDLCLRAGIDLTVFKRSQNGSLTLEKVLGGMEQASDTSVWFCGPGPLGASLEKAWNRLKLPRHRFHRELFSMR